MLRRTYSSAHLAIASAIGFADGGIVGTGSAFAASKSVSSQVSTSGVGNERAAEASHASAVPQAATGCPVAGHRFNIWHSFDITGSGAC
jgi:hypothetical protein